MTDTLPGWSLVTLADSEELETAVQVEGQSPGSANGRDRGAGTVCSLAGAGWLGQDPEV